MALPFGLLAKIAGALAGALIKAAMFLINRADQRQIGKLSASNAQLAASLENRRKANEATNALVLDPDSDFAKRVRRRKRARDNGSE